MSFRVKDFWKNVIVEFDSQAELIEYVSSSQFTSSLVVNEESSSLNYFQYDDNIHQNLESGGLDEIGKNLVRITYVPGEDDDIYIGIEVVAEEESGSLE